MHPLRPRARFGRTARRLLAATAAVAVAALLIPAAASATVALAEKGTLATATGSTITPTLTTATTAGDLLVAAIEDVNGDCANDTFTAPASWVMAAKVCRSTTGPVELWYLPNTAAGATSFAFGSGYSGANLIAQVSEWSGVEKTSPVDQIGTNNSTSASTTLSLSTAAALANANELAVTAFETATGLTSFTPGTGWTALDSDPSGGFDSNYEINPASGAVLSGAVTSSPSTAWGGVIATFFGGCTGGSLTFTPPATVSFTAVTLNGKTQTTTASPALAPSDTTGSGSGWNLTGTSTTFKNSGSKTLPTTATQVTAAGAAAGSSTCRLPTNGIAYPLTLPAASTAPTAVKIYDAAAGTGLGAATVTMTFTLTVPPGTYSGAYTSTWTLSLVSGP
jgi:hypothetical protein